jgi:predicted Zn-dependent peptidase
MNQEDLWRWQLKNGIRVIYRRVNSGVGHCCLMIGAGSRDELSHEHGMAHFIEHVLFKGTKKRKSFHILSRIDSVGGELNAYTTKEETCLYASFQKQYLERAIELLSDICFHSTFPSREIHKEKEVIKDEIQSYLDSPSEQIFDDFEEHLFPNQPLGRTILGTAESLDSFKQQDILKFRKRLHVSSQTVWSVTGDYEPEEIQQLFGKYLIRQSEGKSGAVRHKPKAAPKFEQTVHRKTFQAHCVMGSECLPASDRKRTAMVLLNNMFGGPAMNSRLNLNIREKYGFTYNLESSYTALSDTGLFTIYLGTDSVYLDKTLNLIEKEMQKLRNQKLGVVQLSAAKKQLCGQIALSQENHSSVMMGLARSVLLFDKVDSIQKIYSEIEKISAETMLELANRYLQPKHLSSITYLP